MTVARMPIDPLVTMFWRIFAVFVDYVFQFLPFPQQTDAHDGKSDGFAVSISEHCGSAVFD